MVDQVVCSDMEVWEVRVLRKDERNNEKRKDYECFNNNERLNKRNRDGNDQTGRYLVRQHYL
jgi:hypothetical protein